MGMAHPLRVQVIGRGRLGTSLAAAVAGAGCTVAGAAEGTTGANLVFLCVPDGRIAEVAAGVAWSAGQFAVHCSGALGLEVLEAATALGAVAGCLHPIQTFPSREPEPGRFRGITCGVEAPEPLGGVLESLVEALGAVPIRLEGVDRRLYHAAAVFASNYAVALMSVAGRTWELAGLPGQAARPALAPLLLSAASNIARMELAEALTGPVARGDVETVRRHLAALSADASLDALYRGLGAELLRVLGLDAPTVPTELASLLEVAV